MGYGLGPSSAALNVSPNGVNKRTISIMGDGGFWHNGLASGIGNAVFNERRRHHRDRRQRLLGGDRLARTIPSSKADPPREPPVPHPDRRKRSRASG